MALNIKVSIPQKLSRTIKYHIREEKEQSICEFRAKKALCDVVMIVNNHRIYAHKVILAAMSDYFQAMFTNTLRESQETEVEFHNIDESTMEQLVNFAYTSDITVEENNVEDLLQAACMFHVTAVQDLCCDFLKNQLDSENCIGISSFAKTYSCMDLARDADEFKHHHFLAVMESEEFLMLPTEQIKTIVSSDELNVYSENQVFTAVMNWVRFNIEERCCLLFQLLQHIRLPLLGPEFIMMKVLAEPLIQRDTGCRDMVGVVFSQQRGHFTQGVQPRKPSPCQEVVLVISGIIENIETTSSVERYDPKSNEWQEVSNLIQSRTEMGVALLGRFIYVVGGIGSNLVDELSSMERYNVNTDQWDNDVAAMSFGRSDFDVAVMDGFLYAVGGFTRNMGSSYVIQNTVERYDPISNHWTPVMAMTSHRRGLAVAVLNGCLYAIGGFNETEQIMNSVEKYNPKSIEWVRVAAMNTHRVNHSCVVYNKHIYVAGGSNSLHPGGVLNSVERYSPATNTWEFVASMTTRRKKFGFVVTSGMLMAVGGIGGCNGRTYCMICEIYNVKTNTWKLCVDGQMKIARDGPGVVHLFTCGCSL